MKRRYFAFLLIAIMTFIGSTSGLKLVHAEELPKESVTEKTICNAEEITEESACTSLSIANQVKVETLAASVFPENIEKMNAAETSNITPSDLENKNIFDDISYVETRPVSDTEELTYIETRAGVAGYLYQKTWQTNSSTAMTGATRYNRNIIVVVLGCTGSVYVRGLTYDINYNAADVIISPGTVTGGVTNSYLVEHWFEENYTTPAKVSYMGTVTDLALGFAVPVDFYVTIGNNQVHVFTFNNVEI